MTRITSAVQSFYHPHHQHQGPATNCRITVGRRVYDVGWLSCTAYAMAMTLEAHSIGSILRSGCALRQMVTPTDVTGGLTLEQVASVIRNHWGIAVSVYTGSHVVSPAYVARMIRAGHKVTGQGNLIAMAGTKFMSSSGDVNHAVAFIEVRGGTLDEPDEVLAFDPAADGRHSGIAQGPQWWPWSMAKKFFAYLRPSGAGTPRLGGGKVYCAIFPDSEPHVKFLRGAIPTKPFPDRMKAAYNGVRVHSDLVTGTNKVLYTIPKGQLVVAYQHGRGQSFKGKAGYFGNDDGTEWIHELNLVQIGGAS